VIIADASAVVEWLLGGSRGEAVALAEALQAPLLTFDRKIPEAPGHRAHVVLPT
jgi:predicted nucleic acid-binding protein